MSEGIRGSYDDALYKYTDHANNNYRTIAERFWFADAKDRRNFDGIIPNWGAKWRWGRLNSAIFDQYLAICQTRCKIGKQSVRTRTLLYSC